MTVPCLDEPEYGNVLNVIRAVQVRIRCRTCPFCAHTRIRTRIMRIRIRVASFAQNLM